MPTKTSIPFERRYQIACANVRRRKRLAVLRRSAELLAWVVVAGWLVFAMFVLALRYVVLPGVDARRGDIERWVGNATGQAVHVGKVVADWEGLSPALYFSDVRVTDSQGLETLFLPRVEAAFSWQSVLRFDLRFDRLFLDRPVLHAERRAGGQVWVAGMPVDLSGKADPGFLSWVLGQHDVTVSGARIVWRDLHRGVPELVVDQTDFRLEGRYGRSMFRLSAQPPVALGDQRVDIRGEFSLPDSDASLHGDFYLDSGEIDFGVLQQWLGVPLDIAAGNGSARVWGRVAGGRIVDVSADLALQAVDVRFTSALPRLLLNRLQGRVMWQEGSDGTMLLSGQDVSLVLIGGQEVAPTSFLVEWGRKTEDGERGLALVSDMDIGQLRQISQFLPIDEANRSLLENYAPGGRVFNLRMSWLGATKRGMSFSIEGDFSGLSMGASGIRPGFSGLTGHLRADENGGQIEIANGPVVLDFPAVFVEPEIALDELQAKIEWHWVESTPGVRTGALDVTLLDASFSGLDAAGSVNGRYRYLENTIGEIDLKANVYDGNVATAWRYVPKLVAQPVRDWLRRGLPKGTLRSASVVLKGPLNEFPFTGDSEGRFSVDGEVEGGVVDYALGWPRIEDVSGQVRFSGASMLIKVREGRSAGARLENVAVDLPDFLHAPATLTVKGNAHGAFGDFTRFMDQSPVGDLLGHFYDDMRVSGEIGLKLDIAVPLSSPERTRVMGDIVFSENAVQIDPLLPPITAVRGGIGFSEKAATSGDLAGVFLGNPVAVQLTPMKEGLRINANGSANVADLRRHHDFRALDQLAGTTPWKAEVTVKDSGVAITADSTLVGLTSSLPAPFRKASDVAMPVHFSRTSLPARKRKGVFDQLDLRVGDVFSASLIRRATQEKIVVDRGIVSLGERHRLPKQGLRVVVRQDEIQADQWRAVLSGESSVSTTSAALDVTASGASHARMLSPVGAGRKAEWPMPQVDLRAKSFRLFGRVWTDVDLQADPVSGGLRGSLEMRNTVGEWEWESADKGKLKARLKQLLLPDDSKTAVADPVLDPDLSRPSGQISSSDTSKDIPALDIIAEQFVLGERPLGRMELLASNEGNVWHINRFGLTSNDGMVEGSGRWEQGVPGESGVTAMKFKFGASDLGLWLARFGYSSTVRRGKGSLEGEVNWRGSPMRPDFSSLTGNLKLKAEKGQFNKLKPGVGKLLSLLSLQMLPRRVTLDFNDVFSEGFAFDRIDGTMSVKEGIMRSSDLVIDGPAAKVLMKGEVDLGKETQNVRVTVQPEIGGSVALGAALVVNPVTGAAALLAQKILGDPLNKAFAFEYEITGPWADPSVEKVGKKGVTSKKGGQEAMKSVAADVGTEDSIYVGGFE